MAPAAGLLPSIPSVPALKMETRVVSVRLSRPLGSCPARWHNAILFPRSFHQYRRHAPDKEFTAGDETSYCASQSRWRSQFGDNNMRHPSLIDWLEMSPASFTTKPRRRASSLAIQEQSRCPEDVKLPDLFERVFVGALTLRRVAHVKNFWAGELPVCSVQ